MTNKEAKATLEFFQENILNNLWLSNKLRKKLVEALDLAIKTLEQQLKCGCNTCEYYPMKDQRPQGKWITCNSLTSDNELLDENEYYMCPFCHAKFRRKHDFCVCGADMRGKKNDV